MTPQSRKSNILAIINLAFWLTVLITRGVIFEGLEHNHAPGIFIEGIHLHHFVWGFIILILSILALKLDKKNFYLYCATVGVGLGLVTDEFLYWTRLDFSYWSLSNLIAVLGVGSILLFSYWRTSAQSSPTLKTVKPPEKPRANPASPLVSVVIPAYNESAYISEPLASLLDQTFQNFEIIVVDNNSTDNTAKVAENFGARVIKESHAGVGFARQTGFLAAQGQIIATTDADTIVPKDWLSRIVKEFENPKIVGFGGLYRLYSGPLTARLAIAALAPWAWRRNSKLSGTWNLAGANMAVKKQAFTEVGGFNETLKILEDYDLSQKLSKVGEIKFDSKFLVHTSGRRYNFGLAAGLSNYLPSLAAKPFFKKMPFNRLSAKRKDQPSLGTAIVPLLAASIFLLTIYSSYNAPLAAVRTDFHEDRRAALIRGKEMTVKLWQHKSKINFLRQVHFPLWNGRN